jgi:hypothetical protein
MSKNYKSIIDRDIKCPYYKCSDQVHIKCEGIIPNTSIVINFGNRTDKSVYSRSFCENKMNECKVCQILNKKWGVEFV